MSKVFSAAEAARETGVSRTTITRMLKRGEFPQATKDDDGWHIPLADLLASGLTPGLYTPDQAPDRDHARAHVQEHDQGMTALQHEVELLRLRLESAQRLADERERTIEHLSMALRAIEAPRPTQAVVASPSASAKQPVSTAAPVKERPGLLHRLRDALLDT